jgi:hyperosmotically inducible protein
MLSKDIMRNKPFHLFAPAIVALLLSASAVSYAESSYSPPITNHIAQPSSAAAAKKSTRAANRKLAKDVRSALTKGGDVQMSRLVILAKSGSVTLTGSVPEQNQIQLAEEHASTVGGVTKVVNRLSIETPGN